MEAPGFSPAKEFACECGFSHGPGIEAQFLSALFQYG